MVRLSKKFYLGALFSLVTLVSVGLFFFLREPIPYQVKRDSILEIFDAAQISYESLNVTILSQPGGGESFYPEGSTMPLFTVDILEETPKNIEVQLYIDSEKFDEIYSSNDRFLSLNRSIKTRIINSLSGENVVANGGEVGTDFCIERSCGDENFTILELR